MLTLCQIVGRLFLALILGLFLGFERERLHRSVGLKTFSLVSLTSCFFIILSVQIQPISLIPGVSFDSSRVLAAIVLGVGFLGSGAIIKQESAVFGVTTAANLWMASAIGAGVGLGLILETIFLTLLVVILLFILGEIEKRYIRK
jgi:putative Mg2+ transporter-C (MgtC) family protein